MSKITKKVYPVMGMHCAACANNVEKIVKKQEGVEDASVNLAAAVLTVDFNSDVVSPEQLKDAVMKTILWKNRKKQNIPIMNNYSERL